MVCKALLTNMLEVELELSCAMLHAIHDVGMSKLVILQTLETALSANAGEGRVGTSGPASEPKRRPMQTLAHHP